MRRFFAHPRITHARPQNKFIHQKEPRKKKKTSVRRGPRKPRHAMPLAGR